MTTPDNQLFVVLLNVVPGATTPERLIRAHVSYLRQLDRDGALVLCGPFKDFAGGMVVLRAANRGEAERLALADPFVQECVRTFELRTWLLSDESNNHLGMG